MACREGTMQRVTCSNASGGSACGALIPLPGNRYACCRPSQKGGRTHLVSLLLFCCGNHANVGDGDVADVFGPGGDGHHVAFRAVAMMLLRIESESEPPIRIGVGATCSMTLLTMIRLGIAQGLRCRRRRRGLRSSPRLCTARPRGKCRSGRQAECRASGLPTC